MSMNSIARLRRGHLRGAVAFLASVLAGVAAAQAPSAPEPAEAIAPPKLDAAFGFPVQSQWIAYFKNWTKEKAVAAGDDMRADGARGIICHVQPRSDLPPKDVLRAMLDDWTTRVGKKYLSVFITDHFSAAERARILEWWDRGGASRWDGLILDPEAEWQSFARDHPEQAEADLRAFVAAWRAVAPGKLLACCSYALPDSRSSFHFEWFNELCDLHMPQVYLGIQSNRKSFDGSARKFLDAVRRSFARAAVRQKWGTMKPIVPVGDPYGGGADAAEAQVEGELAIERYGHVSWWVYRRRQGEDEDGFPARIREVFRKLTPPPPAPPMPPSTDGAPGTGPAGSPRPSGQAPGAPAPR